MSDIDLQSLNDALSGEIHKGQLPSSSNVEQPPQTTKEFFHHVKKYCKNAVPNIPIKNTKKFRDAVVVCLKQHYKVSPIFMYLIPCPYIHSGRNSQILSKNHETFFSALRCLNP